MHRTSPPVRVTAFALAAVVATTLFSTIVSHMPPAFSGAPTEARNGAQVPATEVAIVPSRIEVIGVRGEDKVANDAVSSRPRS